MGSVDLREQGRDLVHKGWVTIRFPLSPPAKPTGFVSQSGYLTPTNGLDLTPIDRVKPHVTISRGLHRALRCNFS